MELLFRAPLLLFDIKDPVEIKKHWSEILEAIRLSSEVLFENIRNKQPKELSAREKKSVYRYLLRGKFRATPFGKWAGVGVASWVPTHLLRETDISLDTTLISMDTTSPSTDEYWLNPSLEPWGDGWKFWNFDFEKEQWRYSKSEDSPLIPILRNLAFGNQAVKKERLFCELPHLILAEREKIWNHLIDKQLLSRKSLSNPIIREPKEDHFILGKPEVSEHYREKLEEFFEEAGSLAVFQENHYLSRLTDRFEEEFDDRFVPLNFLWKLAPYLSYESREMDFLHPLLPTFIPNQAKVSNLDLREVAIVSNTKIKTSHTQALFRILENGQILIDNLVFNRPFVYGGRFTHQPEIYDYFKTRSGLIDDVIYADVMLEEGQKARHISTHKSLCPVRINCISGSMESNELDGSNTYLGIQNGKFILMVPKWGKQVIPIFQHPLNPQYITHPLCRILWEVAHQDFLRPIYYSGRQFVDAEYLPQLQWGEIILQPRQWNIKQGSGYKNENELIGHLSSMGVPGKVLVGFQDQELALDLDCKQDRVILYEEIRKNKPIHIHEWLWKSGNHQKGKPEYYPQFLWGGPTSKKIEKAITDENVNYISKVENRDWLSVRVILSPEFQESIISDQLRLFFDGLEQESIRPYYYLFYQIKRMEIRLRCKVENQTQKNKATTLLYEVIKNITDIDHIKITPYYPEHAKYGKFSMPISEELFYQESKLITKLNLKNEEDKISLVLGICLIYLSQNGEEELWLSFLRKQSGKGIKHQPISNYIKQFDQMTSKEWREYFFSLVSRHPWLKDQEKKEMVIGNHLHMLINRIFWREGIYMEEKIFAVLYSVFREKKYSPILTG